MYDEIGNLIEDKAEQITNIKWSVYGKILEISRNATPKVNVTNIKYTYDALGNRISKEYDLNGTKQYFWYVRDAQGNLLGTYKAETETVVPLASLDVNLVERHIYGSSRLGMYALTQGVDGGPADMQYYTTNTFTRGRRQYELSNHLGNVLITLSDRKFGVSSGGSLIDYYEPDMLAGNDYYPFGMLSRVATSTSGTEYRFGFNGKEHDSEAKGWQNQVDYGMRVYDPRIGRFLSVDPLQTQFAYWTPYQYAGNTPIWATDLDGAESILRLPRWMIPEPVLTLPKLPPVPVQPVPPIPPAIPTGFSTPQSPMIPPGPYMPTPPGTAMKPTVGTQNLPRTSTGEIDWDAVGEGIDMTDTQTWPEPPFTGEWKEVDPPAGTKSAEKATELGHKRLQNEQGDIIRPHLPDKYHPKWHWDVKKGGNPNTPWENYTPDGVKIPEGKILGKDFFPSVSPLSLEGLIRMMNWRAKQLEYQQKLKQYEKDMKNYEIEKQKYDKKIKQLMKDHPEQFTA